MRVAKMSGRATKSGPRIVKKRGVFDFSPGDFFKKGVFFFFFSHLFGLLRNYSEFRGVHKDKPTCINCGGQHSAAYQGCEEAKKAKEIQRIKIVNKLTYEQAAKKLTENQQNIEQASTIPTPNQDSRITIDKRTTQTVVQAQIHRNPEPIIDQANKVSNHTELKLPKIPTPEKTMKERATRSTQQKDNFLTTATNEELITFFVKLLVNFVSQSEADVITIIRTAADKFNAPPNPMQAS